MTRVTYTIEHGTPIEYFQVEDAFEDGSVFSSDRQKLLGYLRAISQNVTGDDAMQSRDMIQAITLNHLLLQRYVDDIDRRSSRIQWLVIALAVAALIGTAAQVWIALNPTVSPATQSISPTSAKTPTK